MQMSETSLPQLGGGIFLTDGGMETTLIFHDGIDLPHFAAFTLMQSADGRERIERYFDPYLSIARSFRTGFILETPTWRASRDWGDRMGLSEQDLADVNRRSVALMFDIRSRHVSDIPSIVVSGALGPRGDGYDPGTVMTSREARDYHIDQVRALSDGGAELVTAFTMTNSAEAIGIADAARDVMVPVVISFTLETDGHLPTGQSIDDAIREVDAATGSGVAYYMINCAHPSHFEGALDRDRESTQRIRGLRANASRRSHQELNDAPDLDAGDPVELAHDYRALLKRHPQIAVVGGCCGTDHRHVGEIGKTCCGPMAA